MFCENCATELPENLKFCVNCGQKIILSAGENAAPLVKSCTPAAGKSAVNLKAAPVQNLAPRGLSSKKHILFVILGAVLAVIIAIVSITTGISVSRSHSVEKGFEIAERICPN